MKKLSSLILCSFAACAVSAETWTFDTTRLGEQSANLNITLSSSFGDADNNGWWIDSSGNYMRGQGFSATDDIVIANSTARRIENLLLDSENVVVNNLSMGGSMWSFIRGSAKSKKLTVNGDLILLDGNTSINNADIYIKGDINTNGKSTLFGRGSGNPCYSIVVDGNIYGGGGIFFQANGLTMARPAAERTFENGLANPDVIVNGIVDRVNFRQMGDAVDCYIQVGGISGTATVGRQIYTDKPNSTKSYIIMKNAQSYTSDANIIEYNHSRIWQPKYGVAVYVMNGTGSQEFKSSSLFFQGGIKAMQGTLKMNFNQNASTYWYRTAYTNGTNYTRVDNYTENGGSTLATTSHGDLEMLGGTFGSSEDASSYGAFRITNIKYTNGTIKLRLDSSDKMDSLDLCSYYEKITTYVNGSLTDTSWNTVEGGTLSKAEGADKVTFDFGSNLAWLIDAENDGVKIIAWDAAKKSSLLSDDFAANTFTNTDGDQFKALFAVNDDGLYVKYVAVPEPATVAAIFGAMALAFAAYRRRK